MIIASYKIDKGFSGKLETLFQTVSCSQELLVQTILWNRVPSLPLPWCLSVALLRPHGLLGVALLGLHVLLGLPFLLGTQGVLSLIVIVIRNHEYITILLHLLLPERGNHQPLPPGWRLLQLGSQLPQTSWSRYQPAYPWSPPVQAEKNVQTTSNSSQKTFQSSNSSINQCASYPQYGLLKSFKWQWSYVQAEPSALLPTHWGSELSTTQGLKHCVVGFGSLCHIVVPFELVR